MRLLPNSLSPVRRRQLLVLTIGSLVAVAAAGGWLVWKLKFRAPTTPNTRQMVAEAISSTDWAGGPPGAMHVSTRLGGGAGTAAKADAPATQETFDEACLHPIRVKRFSDAIEGCSRFVGSRHDAGHAHAALAAIYATRSYINIAESVRHAQLAAEAGDGRGKFMVAFHNLTGQSGQPFDLERTRDLLVQAKAANVNRAQQYLDIIDESKRCREHAAFKLFEQPVFCFFRPELTQLLQSKGMTERQKDLEQWIDIYRPGEVLASADRADVVYDRDPKEELHRLSRFVYHFTPQDGVDREALLMKVLTDKYGTPQPMVARKETGGHSEWRLTDGVAIHLVKDQDGEVQVQYTLPARWEAREAHLKRERELEQNAQLVREQTAL